MVGIETYGFKTAAVYVLSKKKKRKENTKDKKRRKQKQKPEKIFASRMP